MAQLTARQWPDCCLTIICRATARKGWARCIAHPSAGTAIFYGQRLGNGDMAGRRQRCVELARDALGEVPVTIEIAFACVVAFAVALVQSSRHLILHTGNLLGPAQLLAGG